MSKEYPELTPKLYDAAYYSNDMIDDYFDRMKTAVEDANFVGNDFASIATPVEETPQPPEANMARDLVFQAMKNHFVPLFPNRIMNRAYAASFNGKTLRELHPKSNAVYLEIIRFYVPGSTEINSGQDGTRVGLVH